MDERIVERLNAVFARLHRPVALLDDLGRNQLSRRDPAMIVPEALKAGEPLFIAGQAFMRSTEAEQLVWAVDGQEEAAAVDALFLAEAVLGELLEQFPEAGGTEYLYRQLLQSDDGVAVSDEELNSAGIVKKMPRCVLVMETDGQWHGDFQKTMRAILPAGPSDVLVAMGRRSVAYLVDMSEVDDRAELLEYASATQESALSESGCSLLIGMGGCASDLVGLHTSYEQAKQALEIGRVFQPSQTVFDYQRMLMPRFLSELPAELAARYHDMLFNAETAKLFSDELLETVNMFFEKDLNLSDTARQLYIHRNTLTYRLDKIAKIIGLDLRHFDDAVTFKMLLEMKKCIKNR